MGPGPYGPGCLPVAPRSIADDPAIIDVLLVGGVMGLRALLAESIGFCTHSKLFENVASRPQCGSHFLSAAGECEGECGGTIRNDRC